MGRHAYALREIYTMCVKDGVVHHVAGICTFSTPEDQLAPLPLVTSNPGEPELSRERDTSDIIVALGQKIALILWRLPFSMFHASCDAGITRQIESLIECFLVAPGSAPLLQSLQYLSHVLHPALPIPYYFRAHLTLPDVWYMSFTRYGSFRSIMP